MKKMILLATAAAMFAAPALAAPDANTTYSDAVGTVRLAATVDNFCRLGNVGNTVFSGTNVNSTNDADVGPEENADQSFVIDIQNNATNTLQAANGGINVDDFVCNTAFKVTSVSTNGGLDSSYAGAAPTGAFLTEVDYEIGLILNGTAFTPATVTTGTQTLFSNVPPFAGSAGIRFNVPVVPGQLLQGTYTDQIQVTIAPMVGTSI